MKRFSILFLIIISLLTASQKVFAEEENVYSIYDEEPKIEVEIENEPDYSEYESIGLDNFKPSDSTSGANVFTLQVSKDVSINELKEKSKTQLSLNPFIDDDYKLDRGLGVRIQKQKFSLGATYSQRSFDQINSIENKVFLTPEFKLTNNLSIKSKLSHTMSTNREQAVLGLNYKVPNSKHDVQLEFKTGAIYQEHILNSQSFEFTTKFKI